MSSFTQRDVGEILVGFQDRQTSIYYFFDSQIFYEVLDIFPRLSYRLTFIMLNVGMVDNLEFWLTIFDFQGPKHVGVSLPGFKQTWQSHGITLPFLLFASFFCLFSFQGQNNFISLMDIHVQHLASLCRICGDKIKDHKRKVDTINSFVCEIHQI